MIDHTSMALKGGFVAFEGGEGAGKTTQIQKAGALLRSMGLDCVISREPGGTPAAEELRSLLVRGDADRWSPIAETLMMYASRDHHLQNKIIPALKNGQWVLTDRFSDSTRAYQGGGGGVDSNFIEIIDQMVVGKWQPDLVIVLDIDPVTGIGRTKGRIDNEDRFEKKRVEFHQTLRQTLISRAQKNPARYHIIDAAQDVDIISDKIKDILIPIVQALRGT
jgi:dTMP kinase